jgi:sarcosine oxidase subunit alpha
MELCREGMTAEGQNAYPAPDLDVLGAVDWLFPGGMNHHTLMTGSRLLNQVVQRVVHQLGGLGQLPDRPAAEIPPAQTLTPDVVVIGAGPAGLAAAAAAAEVGVSALLIDEADAAGGSLLADPRYGPAEAAARAAQARSAGAKIALSSSAIGYYPEDDGGLLAVAAPDCLLRVRARRYVYATGGYAQNRLFGNNDRPGVLAARAVGRLLTRYGVKPANRVCVVGDDDYAAALARALAGAACEVVQVDGERDCVVRARGRAWVNRVEIWGESGKRVVPCDLVAVSAPPAPASEAPRQHGCEVHFSRAAGGFAVRVLDPDGRTTVPGVFACGDVCGANDAGAAATAGARAGAAAAREARAEAGPGGPW